MKKVIVMILMLLAASFAVGNAMAWEWKPSVYPQEPVRTNPYAQALQATAERNRQEIDRMSDEILASHQRGWDMVKEFEEDLRREGMYRMMQENHLNAAAYRNRHSHIYVTGCHHYSESCRMQLRD